MATSTKNKDDATQESTKAAEDAARKGEAGNEDTENEGQLDEGQTSDANLPQSESSGSTATRRRQPQPEGQTIPSGQPGDGDYDEPITAQGFGQTEPTITREEKGKDKEGDFRNSQVAKNFRKLTGYKAGDIMAVNERTHVIVTTNGGKYQLNRKGNQVRHLQGPPIPKTFQGDDLSDSYVDARARSPFTGTAAAINASVNEQPYATRGERANQAGIDADAAQAEAERRREAAENAAAEAGE